MSSQATVVGAPSARELGRMEQSLPYRLVRQEGVLGAFGVFVDREQQGHAYDLEKDGSGRWELISSVSFERFPLSVNADWRIVNPSVLEAWLNQQAGTV